MSQVIKYAATRRRHLSIAALTSCLVGIGSVLALAYIAH